MSKSDYCTEEKTKALIESSNLPLALHLANGLEQTMQWPLHGKAADELRRLHALVTKYQIRNVEVEGHKLAACPFCGKTDALKIASANELMYEDAEHEDCGHPDSWAVVCSAAQPANHGGCGATGGFGPSKEQSVINWNRRG